MHELIRTLLANGPVITDGGWGTQLQARGLPLGACPDQWNLSHPERVGEIPAAYVDAGSQIVLTNTFRANRVALAESGPLLLQELGHDGAAAGVKTLKQLIRFDGTKLVPETDI